MENLERLFSSPPFLKPSSDTADKQDAFELDIGLFLTSSADIYTKIAECSKSSCADQIHIDEPLVVIPPKESDIDERGMSLLFFTYRRRILHLKDEWMLRR